MKDKLYIIGNGFDLHHKLKTTYFDFRNQCLTRSPRLHKYLTEAYGDNLDNEMWWYNFEEMLGKVDYLHLMSSDNGMAIGSLKVGQLQQNEIPSLFGKWICGIDCNIEADLTLDIDVEAQFFTFNYTMILENVYGIDKNNVWHIHNSVDDFKYNKPPIVGHDSCDGDLVMYLSEYRNSKYNVRPDIADNINREIAKGAKKVQNRINQNEEQFHKRYIPHTTKNLFPHTLPIYPSITYHLSNFTQKVIYGDFMVIGEGMEDRKWWTGGGWR